MRYRKNIIIIGTAGNSIDVLDTINEINLVSKNTQYKCIGFLDDNEELWQNELYGAKVLGPLSSALEYQDAFFIFAIGSPFNFWKREQIAAKTCLPIERFETIIHPSASVSGMAKIGWGAVIFQNVTIASNVFIGDQVMILPNSIISHNDTIGDYTCIAGGVSVSGEVTIGKFCYLGTNSAIIGNVNIGDCCLIGMGSTILRDVPTNCVYVGSPGNFVRHTQ